MTKSTRAPLGVLKIGHQFPIGLNDRNDNQLSKPSSRLYREGALRSIPTGNEQLTLIVTVNQPHEISQHDAVLIGV